MSYIAVDSETDATRVVKRIETRTAALQSSPAHGRVVPELVHFGMRTWRELVVRSCRAVYRIEADTVTVLAVVDGRRDLEDLLLERLVRTP